MDRWWEMRRREFLKVSAIASAGIVLGQPAAASDEDTGKPRTNVDEVKDLPRTDTSLPGARPGRVVAVHDPAVGPGGEPDPAVVAAMFARGLAALTGEDPRASLAALHICPDDVVGLKVNPVGPGLISTHHELVEAVIAWLEQGGVPRRNIVIWDRFESMLADAGFTPDRYPGVRIEALQILDEAAFAEDNTDTSGYLDADGRHVSADRFDPDVVYWADCAAPQDPNYLNQHVFTDRRSPFGKLVTRDLTRIINLPVFKNTGNGISMATKNLGYGAIANTGRLHKPLFFDVCTEVLAFPAIRDKLVLNVTDGLRGQYDGGPGANASFIYDHHTLYLATDPFALDMTCHRRLVAKRKAMEVEVNEHPRYTEYLHYGERLGLGIADPARIEVVEA
ncbi:DUF362 domain-containing protein [bacterium]|nr:DUF362 domain-containing protein [bacterium]